MRLINESKINEGNLHYEKVFVLFFDGALKFDIHIAEKYNMR